jgi:predicted transcriptional regulator
MQQRQQPYDYSFSHTTDWAVKDVQEALQEREATVPISIFSSNIPALQAVVRYLREEAMYSFGDIAELLGRAESTIRVTYRNAPKDALPIELGLELPLTYFNYGLSPLETVVYFLQQQQLRNVDIARTLQLDPRTTATVARRIREKEVSDE